MSLWRTWFPRQHKYLVIVRFGMAATETLSEVSELLPYIVTAGSQQEALEIVRMLPFPSFVIQEHVERLWAVRRMSRRSRKYLWRRQPDEKIDA